MDRAAKKGILFVSDEVVNELAKKDDGAHDWVKARPEMVVRLDTEIETHVQGDYDPVPSPCGWQERTLCW